jgi:hypothetical protein
MAVKPTLKLITLSRDFKTRMEKRMTCDGWLQAGQGAQGITSLIPFIAGATL